MTEDDVRTSLFGRAGAKRNYKVEASKKGSISVASWTIISPTKYRYKNIVFKNGKVSLYK